MTIRTKLTLWYGIVLFVSVAILGGGLYFEFVVERRSVREKGLPEEPIHQEINEVVFFYAVPAALLTIAGGWWLTRKALAPVAEISRAAATIGPQNLVRTRLPRSHNGDELDRLSEVFNSMLQRLEESFVREREFTLHASHELKTPLAVMRGQIETAFREKQLDPNHREVLSALLEEIVRCAGIVDSLSFLAKADAGHLTLNRAEVHLDKLVREAFDDTHTLGLSKRLTVTLERCDPVAISGDPHRLRQLLLNLCDNAVKHNIQGGVVSISLRPEKAGIEFWIQNTGPTLNSEQLNRVFDRFYRGDPSHNPNTEGSGLGLSIARSIVKAHGGEITISSHDSQTRVTVKLPGFVRSTYEVSNPYREMTTVQT